MLLREWRKIEELTQAQAAERLGLTQGQISKFETGETRPDWATLEKIRAGTTGAVTPNDFLPDEAAA